MSKVPGTATFKQPSHGQGKTTTAKNKGKVGFAQPDKGKGKKTTAKNKTSVPFTQPNHGKGTTSSKKNPGKASFPQPNRAGKNAAMPKAGAVSASKGTNIKKAGQVAPPAGKKKFTSVDAIIKHRKKKFGV